MLVATDKFQISFQTQYIENYIHALKALVLKLRVVDRSTEYVYSIFECIAGILAYGTIFGNIHSIVDMLDSTAETAQAGIMRSID
jgi:hypothetical protein